MATEIENKYLTKFPGSWAQLTDLFDNLIDVKRITQAYLKPKDNEPSARVRKTVQGLSKDLDTVYHYNKKKFIGTGVHQEYEKEISKSEYEKFLKDKHPDKFILEKTRFVFKYNDQVFELDVFKGPLQGLAILEIELKNKDDTVELPPFLPLIEEVTTKKQFNNFELASRKNKDE